MIDIYPAIDLRGGRVVRLRQGRADAESVYGDDPTETARGWQSQGARWLHVVNLDGAFGQETSPNMEAVARILQSVSIAVQFGGGLRDLPAVESAIGHGISRVVIGTAAIQDPDLVSQAIERWGADRVAVGIDARDGMVATHGWLAQSTISALDLARGMAERGVRRIIFTDIDRDGMLRGIDADGIARLARAAGLKVIASGGVASLQDVKALAARSADGIEGVIIGQALYAGVVRLSDLLQVASEV